MKRVFENSLVVVDLDETNKIVIVRRTAQRAESSSELIASFKKAVVKSREFSQFRRLIVDTRSAVGRNDTEFETEVSQFRQSISPLFETTVILVATIVGQMQVQRLSKNSKSPMLMARSEEEAIQLAIREPLLH
jgi:hypothetical protein